MPMLGEYPSQYLVGRVTNFKGDLGDWKVRLFEQFAGSLHSQLGQVDPGRHTHTLLEHACEMKR